MSIVTSLAFKKNQYRFLPHPILTVVLWLMWLLLNNTLALGHMLLGAFIAFLIPFLSSAFWPERVCIQKPFLALQFIGIVIYDIISANMQVARWVLGSNRHLQPAFMELELALESPLAISVLASTISLTPGTVSCDVAMDRKVLLIHSLHVDDPQAALKEIHERYEKRLLEILKPC